MPHDTIFNIERCGDCGKPLQFEQQRNGYEMAKCCGRTYSRMDVEVSTRYRTFDKQHPFFTRSYLGSSGRNIIDSDYEGNGWQFFGWESPGPMHMVGRKQV